MSNSFVFQNAQIKSRESKLLTLQGVQRLFDAQNVKDAMKVVIELGLANGMTTEDEDFDTVFKNEEENLCTLLKEMNVKGALDVFLLENDYVNLKIASKAYATKSDDAHFLPDGLYETQKIVEALSAEELVGFDKHFLSAIKGVSEILNGENPNPRAIDKSISALSTPISRNVAVKLVSSAIAASNASVRPANSVYPRANTDLISSSLRVSANASRKPAANSSSPIASFLSINTNTDFFWASDNSK